jgi:hypothetical protein
LQQIFVETDLIVAVTAVSMAGYCEDRRRFNAAYRANKRHFNGVYLDLWRFLRSFFLRL